MARPIPVLNWPDKSIICCCVLFILSLGKIWNFFHKFNPNSKFSYSVAVKAILSADFIGMKISVFYSEFYKYHHNFKRGITTIIILFPL